MSKYIDIWQLKAMEKEDKESIRTNTLENLQIKPILQQNINTFQ